MDLQHCPAAYVQQTMYKAPIQQRIARQQCSDYIRGADDSNSSGGVAPTSSVGFRKGTRKKMNDNSKRFTPDVCSSANQP